MQCFFVDPTGQANMYQPYKAEHFSVMSQFNTPIQMLYRIYAKEFINSKKVTTAFYQIVNTTIILSYHNTENQIKSMFIRKESYHLKNIMKSEN